MIHLKNKKSGFTLIEVLFATAIVGVVLIPIYALQGQVMDRIVKAAHSVQRMFVVFDFFLDAREKAEEKGKKIDKKSEDPAMQMHFKQEDLPGKSQLNKTFNNLSVEKASWEWQVAGKKQSDELIALVFTPPEPKPEKEEKEAASAQGKTKTVPSGQQPAASPAQTGGAKLPVGAKK